MRLTNGTLGRAKHRQPGVGRRQGPEESPVLRLQRAVGNRAVGQVLAPKPAPGRRPRQTGLRRGEPIQRYARKAVAFWRRNGDMKLHHFAIFLGAAANVELDMIGCPNVKVISKNNGSMSAAAHFDAENWQITLNPDEFTHRTEVETMGDLNADEAAIIAMYVYHEARHAEQHFRIARLQVAEGKEIGTLMSEETAPAAEATPLKAGGADALELREARDWRTNEIGEDATYREVVTEWQGHVSRASKMARNVKPDEVGDVREQIGFLLRSWRKYGGAQEYIRSHLTSAKARKASLIIDDIARMVAAFNRAEAAWKQLDERSKPADFTPLADALRDLVRAIDKAYRNQPVEHDAWDTGYLVFDAFHKELAAATAAAPAP